MEFVTTTLVHYFPVLVFTYIFYILFIQNIRKKKYTKVENKRLEKIVISKLACAFSLSERLTGLLNHYNLPTDEALLIQPACRVHTKGMKFPIDIICIDTLNIVIGILENVPPEENTRIFPKKQYSVKGTKKVLELASGGAKMYDFRRGDELVFK